MARAGTLPPGDQDEREYQEAAAALRNVGNRWHLVPLNNTAAYRAIIAGSYADAARLLDEVLPLARESGEPRPLMVVWGNLGLVRLLTGDDTCARIAFEEQLGLCRDHNIRRGGAEEGLGGLAALAAHQQHFDRAARLLGAATALGPIADPALMATLERQFFDLARARLGDTRWSDAVQAGRRLAFRDAIELALAAPETLPDHTTAPSSHAG